MIKQNYLLISLIMALFLFSCKRVDNQQTHNSKDCSSCPKIISLAPAITETLCALGLQENIIAVSDYCVYPPEVQKLPKIGALLNPNIEEIIRLKPDCVVLYPHQKELTEILEKLEISTLFTKGDKLQDILETFLLFGESFNRQKEAAMLFADFQGRLIKLRENLAENSYVPKVLLIVWRERGQGTLKNISVASEDKLYSDLIAYAGAELIPAQQKIAYPLISAESILHLDPDIIIELSSEFRNESEEQLDLALKDWELLPQLKAVKNNKIFMVSEDYATVPGPRLILLAEKINQIIAQLIEEIE